MTTYQDFGSAANPARAHLSLLLRSHLTHRKCNDPRGPANGESWASEAVDTDVGEHQDWALTGFSHRKPRVQKGPKGRKSLLSTVLKSFSAHRDPDGCSPASISWIRSSLTLPWPPILQNSVVLLAHHLHLWLPSEPPQQSHVLQVSHPIQTLRFGGFFAV